jgi:hypothetical protein
LVDQAGLDDAAAHEQPAGHLPHGRLCSRRPSAVAAAKRSFRDATVSPAAASWREVMGAPRNARPLQWSRRDDMDLDALALEGSGLVRQHRETPMLPTVQVSFTVMCRA